ncbi:MAG: hypothetical protein ABIT37_04325 [Luteolibacter sp.]
MNIQAVFKNFQRCVLFAVLGLAVPNLVGCDKLASLIPKGKLAKLKEGTSKTAAEPGSTPGSDTKPVADAQAGAKPEQFSKDWLPPGMSRGQVKPPESNQRPQPTTPPHKP